MNHSTQNAELLQKFEADGYVAIPQFVAGLQLDELQANVKRYIKEIVPEMPLEKVFYEDKNDLTTLKQIQDMTDYDTWFHDLLTRGLFRETAQQLLNGPVVPKNLQYFNKPPAVGKPTPPHQDGYYFMLEPNEAITMWFALEDVDEENGCVSYVRGSHQHGMRPHGQTETLGFSQGILDFGSTDDLQNEIAYPAKPGDLLAHHSLTIHRAGGNQSATRSRKVLGLVYFSEMARQDTKAIAEYQSQLTEKMKTTGKI